MESGQGQRSKGRDCGADVEFLILTILENARWLVVVVDPGPETGLGYGRFDRAERLI